MVHAVAIFFYFRKTVMRNDTKKTTERRVIAILLAFAVFAGYLTFNIFHLDFVLYDYYREKTFDQVTTSSTLKAERGAIYDTNMNVLAATKTVWRVFISTRDIKSAERASGIEYSAMIANGLAPILSLNSDLLLQKIKGSNVLDVTVKRDVEEDEYLAVMEFIRENNLERLVFTEASTSRYYPGGTLAAHVLGFTGSDNQGLYGLEYYYEKTLSGKDGYYVYAKDANGNALDTEYSSYFPAEDGCSLVTTIDSYVQSELEAILETIRVNHAVNNRVTGIVMDTDSGAILAMATTSAFDPNDPFTLDEVSESKLRASGLTVGSEEYRKLKTELMQIMWSNKAVSETYEPGSTFKIVTVSAALDKGVVTAADTFSCKGYAEVGGWKIRCHKAGGHGAGFNLAYGLQMSCNPCMISVSEKLGAESFYSYVKAYGLLDKTGIDLPSEAGSIFHDPGSMGATELATASFGQRFKVSVINMITAISAVANGGELVTPYVVDRILDASGNTVFEHGTEIKRTVVSKEVSALVSQMLIDGVNGNGGAKNAGVTGYDIAAKTGTSQKFDVLDENGNSYLRIGSTVAYSADAEHGIATIIVVDEPTSAVKYGSVVAAPYVSMLLEKVLPYLEFRSDGDDVNVKVENYVGLATDTAAKLIRSSGINCEIVGDGDRITSQIPPPGETFTYPISKVILYTNDDVNERVTVPNLVGSSMPDAIKIALNCGLNIKFDGMGSALPSSLDVISHQSIPPGESVPRGTVINLRAICVNFED